MKSLTRQSYQQGSLTLEQRNRQKSVWVYRWREAGPNGTRVRRKRIIGTTDDYKTKAAAQRAVDGLRLEINTESPIAPRGLTVAELSAHFLQTELAPENVRLSPSTKSVYGIVLDTHILPQWGNSTLRDLRPIVVEKWLESLQRAPGTRAKIRNLLSALFQHAIRHGWAENNPINTVRVSAKRQTEPDILEPVEIQAMLEELSGPVRTMVMMAATTGLRVSEILGLKWQDVDLDNAVIRISRGVVNQQISALKTIGSRRPVPATQCLIDALREWLRQSSFIKPEDWVFASPSAGGKQPYWPNTLLDRHILPAAKRAGIGKRIGWHSFRRTFATLLYANEQDVKTAQELMRHSSPVMTLGTYAAAITERKRAAQERLAATILQGSLPEQASV